MIGNPLLLGGGDYEISRSVRLRSSASAYFNRTPASAGNRRTWTWSGWVKRGALSALQEIFEASDGTGSNEAIVQFNANDTLTIYSYIGAYQLNLVTTQVFRDPSAWFHLVLSVDTTQATSSDRAKLYINGTQVTAFSTATYPTQNYDTYVNTTQVHSIGRMRAVNGRYLDGYLTEINFIDGQALTPSSFGESNATTGVWQPKKYTGTYGTNGFYLNFSDNSNNTAATIGKDYSGNGNNWTPNNISVTAGVTYDSMLDVPTQWADGGNGRGNYAVLNPLTLVGSGTGSLSNGNLTLTSPTSDAQGTQTAGTIAVSSGKYYWEETFTTLTSGSGYLCAGLQDGTVTISGLSGSSRSGANTWWVSDDGNYRANGGSVTSSGLGAFSAGDVAMIAVDMDNKIAWIGKNGTWVGSPSGGTGNTFSSLPNLVAPFAQAIRNTTTSSVINANFGQRPFAYTPPTGFKALNTLNLPEPVIKKGNAWFDATLYTGTGASQSIVNAGGFQPDFVWTKSRSAAESHRLYDAVRGATNSLYSNLTNAEATEAQSLTAFNSNGFTLGTGAPNTSSATYVAWQWKEGATQGFDIVTYTGTGANRTVSHSLGVAPSMMIVKIRSGTGSPDGWGVYHASLGNTQALTLETTSAAATSSTYWNNTSPSSSVFTVGTWSRVNNNGGNYVAYLFSEVAGFSRFGSYTGNGSSDGPFVFCGFRPRFIMLKNTAQATNWRIHDTSRDPENTSDVTLYPNGASAEDSGFAIDILSNGFKLRFTDAGSNGNGNTIIFAAFAENPFKNALAR
jgi:hypothetical protein